MHRRSRGPVLDSYAYRERVNKALQRSGRKRETALYLTRRWHKLIDIRRLEGKSAKSTASHILRFRRQRAVRPYDSDVSREEWARRVKNAKRRKRKNRFRIGVGSAKLYL